jgi:hypothetical protein
MFLSRFILVTTNIIKNDLNAVKDPRLFCLCRMIDTKKRPKERFFWLSIIS